MNLLNDLRINKSVKWVLILFMLLFQAGQALAEVPDSVADVVPRERIGHRIDDTDRIRISGNRLPQLDASEDNGAVDNDLVLKNMMLVLKSSPEQQVALDALSIAQQTPGAPEFHRWLTPEEFANHFGVANQDINAIKNYLISQGFSIDQVAAGGRSIMFSGTAAQVNNTFRTEIHHYVWRGETHISNNSEPQIPAAFSDVVGGVANLHDFFSRVRKQLPQNNTTPSVNPLPGDYSIQYDIFPISDYTSGSSHFLTPGDYGVIYDINPLYNSAIKGSNVKIAVLGRSNILNSDVTTFQSFAGLPTKTPQTIITNTNPGYVSGDQTESSLDVEWAGGVAPGATVYFITSSSTSNADGIALSAIYAVNNNVGDIISLSYGQCENSTDITQIYFWNYLWQQAQTQGQTVLVSSGDSGAAGCDSPSSTKAVYGSGVNVLCSSQYSTCVGGTEFMDTTNPSTYWSSTNSSNKTSALSYIPEMVWNESGTVTGGSGLWASGGGKSGWAKPSWQVSPGVPADGRRDVPDVAMAAAQHDGYLIYMNGQQYLAGGTSCAAPSLAGIIALLEQYNGGRQGNINPALYGLYQLQTKGSLGNNYFHPTLSGNNSVPGQTGFSATGAGYNLATGLGSVDANLLVTQWRNVNPVTASVALSGSSANLVGGQAVTFTATVSGAHPTGSIQFQNNGVNLGSAVALSNGVASLTTSALTAPGLDSITAVYSGDGNNLTSTSAALTVTVIAVATVTVTVSASTVTAGQSLTLTAMVAGYNPDGTVQFYINGSPLGAPIALVNGIAVLNTNSLTTAGQDVITAAYSGNGYNAPATSATVTETVLAATTVTVTVSASTVTAGQSLTLTATVTGVAPSGTVQFYINGSPLGAPVALVNGVAVLTTNSLTTIGQDVITAAYSGDSVNSATTTPAAITETVTAAQVQQVPALAMWQEMLLAIMLFCTLLWIQKKTI